MSLVHLQSTACDPHPFALINGRASSNPNDPVIGPCQATPAVHGPKEVGSNPTVRLSQLGTPVRSLVHGHWIPLWGLVGTSHPHDPRISTAGFHADLAGPDGARGVPRGGALHG